MMKTDKGKATHLRQSGKSYKEISAILNIPKSTVIQGRHKTKRVPRGICIVNVSSTYFKQKMLMWMQFLPTQLLPREQCENI